MVAASSRTPKRKADKWLAEMYRLTHEAMREMGPSLPPGFVLDVAVLDTGCLDGADRAREFGVFNSRNFCLGNPDDVCDNNWHGTHLVGQLIHCPAIIPWQIHALKVSKTSDIAEEDQDDLIAVRFIFARSPSLLCYLTAFLANFYHRP